MKRACTGIARMRFAFAAIVALSAAACSGDSALAPRIEPAASVEVPSTQVSRVVLGTFDVSYYSNAGGCFGDPNPYFCVNIAPGPIHVAVSPGCYQVKVLSGLGLPGNATVWDGTSAGGQRFALNPTTPRVRFTHTTGEITLYHYDWFPWDNDPSAIWSLELSRLGTATTC